MSNSKKKAARKQAAMPKKSNRKTVTVVLCVLLAAAAIVAGVLLLTRDKHEEKAHAAVKTEDFPIATIVMEDGGEIVLELNPNEAYNTVANFVSLANSGFYDGLIFHRVISGFMIQGGDPTGTGYEGPGYKIKGEFSANGVNNTLKHERGVISMARSNPYDSAGSQFFIMHKDAPSLDGLYAAFGKVLEGMDVVDRIASVKTDANDRPLTEQKIASIRVDTKGIEYKLERIQ